jgi:prepilin-type N-terminal cleavage/methylation domain-containing protein
MRLERQRGFTLIELMVALLVSSLLVGMILAIFSRMSLAYRGQQQVAGVQQVLAAARATIDTDAKQAGFAMPQGFRIAKDKDRLQWPVQIVDSATAPDQVAFFYGDSSAQAVVSAVATWGTTPTVTVDTTEGFAAGDLVVLAAVDTSSPGLKAGEANIAKWTSCVMQIDTITGPPAKLQFKTAGSWGRPASDHCATPTAGVMIYKFVARGYRIDRPDPANPANAPRLALGALQQSKTGGLLKVEGVGGDDWLDVAYGFTDIQTALRVFDDGTLGDLDKDGTVQEWLSGGKQFDVTRSDGAGTYPDARLASGAVGPLQMSISLVARTDRDVEGVATSATPDLLDPAAGKRDTNSIGNRASVPLPSTDDEALKGSRIYRYITFQVDFRNIGIGK